ncbi:helix-turn-helix transcriptional regulator [Streptomyces niveiscabiei]|uniref:helix-turn-helix transcriptional regulator n=1 Tax=Streptomyces niveiscabiei TaxID=164115 RepID=UPI00099ED326|nr:helix-turn-helix transcriptional regulator [Streptomyces niveiscabiei]
MAGRRTQLAARRKARGFTQESFAEELRVATSTVQRWESGVGDPQPHQRPKIAKLLEVTSKDLEELLTLDVRPVETVGSWTSNAEPQDDEMEAWELARRVQASDVGRETLIRLERSFDELAMAYPTTPPQVLLDKSRRHISYVAHLLDGKKTLSEHRRLLLVGGWFSLFAATLHIDLKDDAAAVARLQTAVALSREAEHPEIEAWCFETNAWRVLTDGDYNRAVELSRIAQSIAPPGTSALIQATAQEGRAQARLCNRTETYTAINRVQALSDSLGSPLHPKEHHYQYDPAKALSYTATTLAWLGDSAAEPYAREVITQLSPSGDFLKWPRRVASANIDLALVLLNENRLDEACDAVQKAILSGRVVPSNHWRALEVVAAVERRSLPEAKDLREAYEGLNN